ncbi:MAG: hypothetical protein R3218_09285, partial [Christiangramia sp.]|nr:hypothetical protein [Christiangramia sp.]
IYKDPETNRLKAAAYIVTFSKEKDKAEENPHAIVYSDYKSFENIDIATGWSFHNWSDQDGFREKLGEATITNLQFFDPQENYFKAPEDSKPVNR